jgi:molybdate transport system substrate-binding protein
VLLSVKRHCDCREVNESDHPIRKIAAVLDLSWVRSELAPFYPEMGRPSIDPELMIRMLIIGYVFAIRSERVTTGSGSSQGTGPQTIGAQLARGVPANVVILSREGLNELIAANRITAGTDVDLARVPLGVAVRTGTPKPDVSTVEAVKQLLLNVKTVAVPASTSGIWLITDLFPRLGIAEKVNVKPTPRGTGATSMVAAGEAEIAVMPVSEILHATGVDFAGTIPPEIQFVQVFSAAVVTRSGQIEDSKRLIEFLASGRASEAIRNSGMEPLASSR